MRLKDAWINAKNQLLTITDEAPLEAEVLLRHSLDIDRSHFLALLEQDIQLIKIKEFESLIHRRLQREPLAYIIGHREFYGLEIAVTPDVLIPRQETELLVEQIIESAKTIKNKHPIIADIGTGSGAIAIATATHLPLSQIYCTDISEKALHIANMNLLRHQLDDRIHLLLGDLLEPIEFCLDIIVSNLPYLTNTQMINLPPEIKNEPPVALHGGRDGLKEIRRLMRNSVMKLRPKGTIILEIDPSQEKHVMKLAEECYPSAKISPITDLSHMVRVIKITL